MVFTHLKDGKRDFTHTEARGSWSVFVNNGIVDVCDKHVILRALNKNQTIVNSDRGAKVLKYSKMERVNFGIFMRH